MSFKKLILTCCACVLACFTVGAQKVAGALIIEEGISPGYTLFAPLNSKTTYLIDNCGRVINKWESNYYPGNTAYLMPNGNLLRTKKLPNDIIPGGGGGGGVELIDWNSNLVWSFELNSGLLRLHHDVTFLPNGNILMIVWELRTEAEATEAGRDPATIPGEGVIWSEQIIEVKPTLPAGGEIVWKWSLWDHLIQDFDSNKPGFGTVADHPELVDVNFVSQNIPDWIHANSIDYNAELDQIVLSSPFLNELWVIDHGTTTAEAAGHAGGKANRGGDLLYRWGNPLAYQRGSSTDQKLFGQHDVHWVKDGEHGGKIILFNNNKGSNFSSVDIIEPPLNASSGYDIGAGAFGPDEAGFVYTAIPKEGLFSSIMAGAEMLPNGNLLICSSRQGIFYEVTPANEIVWLYKSPVTVDGIVGRDFEETDAGYKNDLNFRTIKYSEDYAAFADRTLSPKEPIEGKPWASCALVTAIEDESLIAVDVYPNPITDHLVIQGQRAGVSLSIQVLDIHGQEIISRRGTGSLKLDLSDLSAGVYLLKVNNRRSKIMKAD
jgi:hypothetical protein